MSASAAPRVEGEKDPDLAAPRLAAIADIQVGDLRRSDLIHQGTALSWPAFHDQDDRGYPLAAHYVGFMTFATLYP